MSCESLLSKFKGALVGAVVGDCIGSVFEGYWGKGFAVEKVLRLSIEKLETEYGKHQHDQGKETNIRSYAVAPNCKLAHYLTSG
jgi:ADP-ribosylglycohydrolase